MSAENEVANILASLKGAVSSAVNEQQDKVSIEIKELSRVGQAYTVVASFKVTPFFVTRMGTVYVALLKTEKGFEITSLRIEDKGL